MKRVISILTVMAIIVSLSVFAGAESGKTVFYLDYGDVVLNSDSVSGYNASGIFVSKCNPAGYVITQKTDKALARSITVESGEQNVELLNLNISRTGSFDYAVCVLNGAKATLTISGTNNIMPGLYRAGIDISANAEAIIDGDGVLNVSSRFEAAIGGGNGRSNGTLTIESGTINAVGGIDGYSAGIGGGTSGSGGSITINGGIVNAKGGSYAAGIGGGNLHGGGNIVINGGTVTAVGGLNGAGIGGGYMGNGDSIIINGGSVKATAGQDADAIGNGYNCKTAFAGLKNSAGQGLSLVTFEPGLFDSINFAGSIYFVPAPHADDTMLYFYVPSSASLNVIYADGSVGLYVLSNGRFVLNAPFMFKYLRYKDMLIVNDLSSLKTADGYSLAPASDGKYELKKDGLLVEQLNIYLKGDVNTDGTINSADALMVLKCAVQQIEPDGYLAFRADYSEDGAINSFDALRILQYVVSI